MWIELSISAEVDEEWKDASIEVQTGDDEGHIDAVARRALEVSETTRINYRIESFDSIEIDLRATRRQVADLLRHDNVDAVMAALEAYHNDIDQAIILLENGYTVWTKNEIVDNLLEDYDLPAFIRAALNEDEIFKVAKEGRTLIKTASGGYVEFYR